MVRRNRFPLPLLFQLFFAPPPFCFVPHTTYSGLQLTLMTGDTLGGKYFMLGNSFLQKYFMTGDTLLQKKRKKVTQHLTRKNNDLSYTYFCSRTHAHTFIRRPLH